MGDLALLVCSPKDALNYYRQALEVLGKTQDFLWMSSVQEGMAALKWFERTVNLKAGLEEEMEDHLREALSLLKKTKFTTLEIECFFKFMLFRKDLKDKVGLNKTINLFLKTFDPESPPDKCKFYVFVSTLYGSLGMQRKQAFYLKLASNFIRNINRQLSDELLNTVMKMYGFQDNKAYWPSLQLSLA
jgi:hypothetical protein